jgi:hypothetical protein
MAENGSPVTWREMNLRLKPIEDDVGEIKTDVKTLLGKAAGDAAVSSWQRFFFGTVAVAVISIVTTAVLTLTHI